MKYILFTILILIIIVGFVGYGFYKHENNLPIKDVKGVTTHEQTRLLPVTHIVVIVMENKQYTDVVGNSSAPYINSLISQNTLLSNYSAVAHPSLPNYLALLGGSTFGVTSDCESCFIHTPNLVDKLEKQHISWKAYMESMPSPCFIGSADPYAQKHNPFMYFDDIRENQKRCQQIVPLTNVQQDIKRSSLPQFIWISPNLCHDMHNCSVQVGDTWLSVALPSLLESLGNNSIIFLTWDEADDSFADHIPTIVIGNDVKKGYISSVPYTHYSLLRTIEYLWHLPALTPEVKNSQPITDIFQ